MAVGDPKKDEDASKDRSEPAPAPREGREGALDDLVVLVPVCNDWTSLAMLLDALAAELDAHASASQRFRVLVVDDGSAHGPSSEPRLGREWPAIESVDVLQLSCNVGHQRAIALGLAWAASELEFDGIVVMDGDGEDAPADVLRLIDAGRRNPGAVIFAGRSRRSEGPLFRLGYLVYKGLYRLMTGRRIAFGNFSLLPRDQVRRLVSTSAIWSHFAAGILHSGVPVASVPTARAGRLAGRSHMNYVSLIVHGLSAVSVHLESVAVRLLLITLVLFGAALTGLSIVVGIRLLTTLAIPGWASTLGMLLGLIGMQAMLMSLFLVFIILHARTQPLFIPGLDFRNYVRELRPVKAEA